MKKADVILILIVLLLAVPAAFVWAAPFGGGAGRTAVVIWDNKAPARLPLGGPDGDYTFGDHGQIVIRVEEGRARFAVSDCPDQLCVRSGWLSTPGRVAACLPNLCVLQIEGEHNTDSDMDIIAG